MILTTKKMVFVSDPEDSDKYIENLKTEYNTLQYRIKIDRTQEQPYYELFYERKEGKRKLHTLLFSSSKIEKVINFFDENI